MPEPEETLTDLSTPILDSAVLPPLARPQKEMGRFTAILILIAGIVVMLPIISWIDKSRDPKTGFILLVSAFALTITIHELGHLAAGWMVGFRFRAIQLGPLSLIFEYGKPMLRLRRETLTLGSVGMHVETVRRLRRRLLIHIAGGPAANLLSIPTALILVNHVFIHLGETKAGTLAAQFSVFSLLVAVVNLIPIRFTHRSILQSDGEHIAMLLRSRDRGRRFLAICALANLYDNGVRARDWKRTWVQSAASVHDTSLDAFIGDWLAYMSANDRKDATLAAVHLEKCLDLADMLPPSVRDIVAQEAAVFAAWFRDDASLADRWVTQVQKPRKMQLLVRLRLDVALRCAHRDYDASDIAWREGLTFIEKASAPTAREQLRESWLEWQAEIQHRRAQRVIV